MSSLSFSELQAALRARSRSWLVTGAAGFIGSNLVEALLKLDQRVAGFDNFSTGHRRNLDLVRDLVAPEQWARFNFIEGDLRSSDDCRVACRDVELVLHQGALGSVPRSLEEPLVNHAVNATGTLNLLIAARDAGIRRVVFASSSSIYGDHPGLPKVEREIGKPLSPYAASKLIDEIYADVCARCYGLETIGLRYFNVFGPRQDPEGAYAAVIPRWIAAMLKGQPVLIFGDGETSRDFCYIRNVVQANLLAATARNPEAVNQNYNIAVGGRTTLNELFHLLRDKLQRITPGLRIADPVYKDFRAGDVRHSLADTSQAQRLLGYAPTHSLGDGLDEALGWYKQNVG